MDIKFNKDAGAPQHQETHGEKKNQSALLALLLVLVGGFAYIYFFTSLIKPVESQTAAVAPVTAPQVVKMPLPVREGEPAKQAEKTVIKAEAEVPAAKPTPPPATKVAVVVPAPKESPKTAAVKPAEKKPVAVPVAVKKAGIPKTEEKKAGVADRTPPPAKEKTKKTPSDPPVKRDDGVKTTATGTDPRTIIVGNYVLEEVLSADMGRVRKAGFEPIVKPAARKKTTMNRLFVSEFAEKATALSTLEKLKRLTSDAFVIEQGGKFAVYAGSYLQSEAASSEKERLKGAGFSTTLKRTEIAIPSQSLSVGPFPSKKAADAAIGKLKGAGIKATISQK